MFRAPNKSYLSVRIMKFKHNIVELEKKVQENQLGYYRLFTKCGISIQEALFLFLGASASSHPALVSDLCSQVIPAGIQRPKDLSHGVHLGL